MNVLLVIPIACIISQALPAAEPKPNDRLRWGQSRDVQNRNIRLYNQHNDELKAIHEASSLYIAREGSQLLLRGKVCLRLLEELVRIKRWTQSVDPEHSFPEFPSECTTDLSGKIFLDATAWLLPVVVKNVGKVYPVYGANCLNTTLRALGIPQAPRYTGQAAFCEQIELFCSPVLKKEDLRPGDIFSVGFHDRSPGLTSPLHSFTWISDDLVYEKGGAEVIYPGRFVTLAVVWQGRKVSSECVLPPIPAPTACEHYARAYRCRPVPLKAAHPNEIDLRSLELIDVAEKEIERFTQLDVIPEMESLKGIHGALEYQANLTSAALPKFDKRAAPTWKRASKLTPSDHTELLSTRLYELKREYFTYIEGLESHIIQKRLSALTTKGLIKDFHEVRLDFKYETAWQLALAELLVDKPAENFLLLLPYLKDSENDPALDRSLRKALYLATTVRADLVPYFGEYPRKD